MKNYLLFAIVVLFCLIPVAGVSLYFYVQTDHARDIVLNRVNTLIPGSADLNRFKFSLSKTSIQIDGFTLLDHTGSKCLEVQSLFIDVRFSALLNKTIEIVELRLDHPRILMTMDAGGRINLLDAVMDKDYKAPDEMKSENKKADLPLNIVLAKAVINKGYFSLAIPKKQVTVGDVFITLTHADLKKQQLLLDTRLRQTELLLDSRPTRIHDIHIQTNLKPEGHLNFQAGVVSDILELTCIGDVRQLFKAPVIDVNLRTDARLDALQLLLKDQVHLKGIAELSFSGKGPVSNPLAEANLKVSNLGINEDLDQGNMNLALSLDDRLLTLESLQLDLLGAHTSMSGQVDLAAVFPGGFLRPPADPDQITYSFSFDQQNGDFHRLDKWIQGFAGRFSTQGRIEGRGISADSLSLVSQATLSVNDFKKKSAGTRPLDIKTNFTGNVDKGIIHLEPLKITAGDTVINADGSYDMKNQQVKAGLTINVPDLTRITGPMGIEPIKGAISSVSTVTGNAEKPEISARIMADNLFAREQPLPALRFHGRLTPSGKGHIHELKVMNKELSCDITGWAELFDPGFKLKQLIRASLSAQGDNINIGALIEKFEPAKDLPPFESKVDFNLNFQAELPTDSDSTLLKTADVDLPEIILDGKIDLSEKKIKVLIENILSLQAGLSLNQPQNKNQFTSQILFKQSNLDPLFEAFGMAGIKLSVDGQIEANGHLPMTLSPDMIETLNTVQGNIDMDARLSGNLGDPDYNARLNLTGLKGEIGQDLVPGGIKLAGLNAKIEAVPEKLTIDSIHARINEGGFRLNGHALMENNKISQVVLKLDADHLSIPTTSEKQKAFEIDQLNADFEIAVAYDESSASGNQETGLLSPPTPFQQIVADIDLTDPGIHVNLVMDETLRLRTAFDPETSDYSLDLKMDQTVLDRFLKAAGLGRFNGKATGHLQSNGKLNKVLPADVVANLKQATGNIALKTSMTGPVKQPVFDLHIHLSDLGYPIPQAGTTISGLNGIITASQDRFEIQQMTANLGTGSFSLNGEVDLENYQPVKGDIRFTGRKIEIEIPDMANVVFNSDLKYTGGKEKSDLSGTMQLIKGEYYKDFTFDLADSVGRKKRKTKDAGKKSGTGNPFVDRTSLNIDIDYKDPFTVDNNIAFILIEPDVTVTGTADNPIVTGRAKIIEGTIIYLKKEFEIEKGIIDFVDPYKTDPDIDLVAKNQIRDWLIRLEITGKTDNLNFKLYSEPQESHEDILSLLITGKTTMELGKGDGSYTKVLADKASDVIGKTVEESTPLDTFKVGYGGSRDKGSNVSVTMGKKLSRRLQVTYSMETEDEETVHTSSAEYKLLENLMLKAFNDSKGDFGTEFKFKLEFR